jgi:hypothetical protein
MIKIDRSITASLAISALLGGLIGWLVSSNNQPNQVQPNSTLTASVKPTQSATEETSETLEDPNPKNLPAGNIWTYNCEIPVQLPESFYLTCADGGWYVYNIKWQSWGQTEAQATAMYSENVCEPNCAEGYRVEAPVELTISTSAKPGKKIYLTDLVMTASTKKNFNSGDRSLTWDLGEFAKMME